MQGFVHEVSVTVAFCVCERWHVTGDSWQVTCDRWQLKGEKWQVICDRLQVIVDRWHVTGDRWHMTGDTWHVTYDTWHVTCDTWSGVNNLSKFPLPSSYGLGGKVFWRLDTHCVESENTFVLGFKNINDFLFHNHMSFSKDPFKRERNLLFLDIICPLETLRPDQPLTKCCICLDIYILAFF